MEKQQEGLVTIHANQELKKSPSKILFSKLFAEKLLFENSQNKKIWQIQRFSKEKIQTPSFVTFRYQEKNADNEKENSTNLPFFQRHKKKTMIDKYFSRNDIVKQRSEESTKKYITFLEKISPNKPFKTKKHNKISSKTKEISRIKKTWTRHDKTTDRLEQKSLLYDKNDNKIRLQQEMKEWALIKKKNEYEVFKLIRMNNHQRMKSNMIIAQAMNQLIDKREELLRREYSSKDIYIPLNQRDITVFKFSNDL